MTTTQLGEVGNNNISSTVFSTVTVTVSSWLQSGHCTSKCVPCLSTAQAYSPSQLTSNRQLVQMYKRFTGI